MIRYLLATALAEMARHPREDLTPEERELLSPIWDGLNPMDPSPQDWVQARRRAWSLVAREVARLLAQEWDRYGAPTVAKDLARNFFAHYEGPLGERVLYAGSKREAYRRGRMAWITDLLDPVWED